MGKLNINTREGWAKYAAESNRQAFISTFGRDPIDSAEVTAWVNAIVAEADELYIVPEKTPEPTLEIIDGEAFWVTRF